MKDYMNLFIFSTGAFGSAFIGSYLGTKANIIDQGLKHQLQKCRSIRGKIDDDDINKDMILDKMGCADRELVELIEKKIL
jgi:hypothetical protein